MIVAMRLQNLTNSAVKESMCLFSSYPAFVIVCKASASHRNAKNVCTPSSRGGRASSADATSQLARSYEYRIHPNRKSRSAVKPFDNARYAMRVHDRRANLHWSTNQHGGKRPSWHANGMPSAPQRTRTANHAAHAHAQDVVAKVVGKLQGQRLGTIDVACPNPLNLVVGAIGFEPTTL